MPRKKKPKESPPPAVLPLPERLELFLLKLGERGDTAEALKASGLSLAAVTYRRKKDPDFDAGWDMAMEKCGRGRDHLVFLDVLSKTGNETEALRLSGLKRADVRARQKSDPGFNEMYLEAQEVAGDALEAEARRRAVDGVEDLVIQSGEPVYHRDARGHILCDELGVPMPVTKKIYSDRLLDTLLKANKPGKFRENIKVDHAVTGGVLLLAGKAPSEEEWEKRMEQKRLERAGKIIENGDGMETIKQRVRALTTRGEAGGGG